MRFDVCQSNSWRQFVTIDLWLFLLEDDERIYNQLITGKLAILDGIFNSLIEMYKVLYFLTGSRSSKYSNCAFFSVSTIYHVTPGFINIYQGSQKFYMEFENNQ